MNAIVFAAAWCLAGEGDGAFRFRAAETLPAGARPQDVAIADLDGDGALDIVVANRNSNDVSVLPGRGHGVFAPAIAHPAGSAPAALAVGDLDGDGAPDIVVANFDRGTISVLMNDGRASFAAPRAMDAGSRPHGLVLADLDRNGVLDIAATNRESDDVSLFLNSGGMPVAARRLETRAQPTGIVAGDVDRDGRVDLVIACTYADVVLTLYGDGRGGFPRRRDDEAGKWVSDVVLADLDRDGDLDIGAATLSTERHASVLRNRGEGVFEPHVRYAVGRGSHSIVAGDFDLDRAMDLAVSNTEPASVVILRNNGDGLFDLPAVVLPAGGADPRAIAAADLDIDGDLDLVTADFLSDSVSILWNERLGATCPADLDRSGAVDRDDLAALLAAWGRADSAACDLDDDCIVGASDLALLMRRWGPWRAAPRAGRAR